MTNTVIQERTDEKGWIHRIEIPLTTFLREHDFEAVVRCKDCQHFKKTFGWNTLEYTECDHFDCDVSEDGFCSWGEREDAD